MYLKMWLYTILWVFVFGKVYFIDAGGPFIDNRQNGPGQQSGSIINGCSKFKCSNRPGLLKQVTKEAVDCAFNDRKPCCLGDNGQHCKRDDGKRDTAEVVNEIKPKGRRRRSIHPFVAVVYKHLRNKRQIDLVPQPFWWRCDNAGPKCCRTCRRTIPFVEPFFTQDKVKVWPVYCPKAGGFQLIDQVECRKQGCKKNCRWDWTYYSYLVTTVEPDSIQGHCNMEDAPTFFTRVKIFSHCNCPELKGSKKKKKNRGGK